MKKNIVDNFPLLSVITKNRIKGLIEKKLTASTIALFANEYEIYDVQTRLEVIQYISYLMDEQLSEFMLKMNSMKFSEIEFKNKKSEFENRQRNIEEIQKILELKEKRLNEKQDSLRIKLNTSTQKTYDFSATNQEIKKPKENKVVKKIILEQKEKLSKPRVEKVSKSDITVKKTYDFIPEVIKKDAVLNLKEPAIKNEKVVEVKPKTIKPKVTEPIVKKPKIDVEKISKENSEKEYARMQLEKEKLWKELYGKTREQSSNDNKKREKITATIVDHNKLPSFDSNMKKSYKLHVDTINISELIDPANKLFSFWKSVKNKAHVNNLFDMLEKLDSKSALKIYKKRTKYMKKYLVNLNSTKTNNSKIIEKQISEEA